MFNRHNNSRSRIKPMGEWIGEKQHLVTPSLKIYYDEYPYKLVLHGNIIKYDIARFSAFYKAVQSRTWRYREQWTQKSCNYFFTDLDVVLELVEEFPDLLQSIHGPISEQHIDSILGIDATTCFRKNKWYNKYDVKISFFSNQRYANRIRTDYEEIEYKKELTEYINNSYNNAKWYTNNSAGTWWCNYLYCTKEEHREIVPFLKLSYGDMIEEITVCKVINNVLEEGKNE